MEESEMEFIRFKGQDYDASHGSAFDRGMSDSYYNRPKNPHMWPGGVFKCERVILKPDTEDYDDYLAGYEYNEKYGGKNNY